MFIGQNWFLCLCSPGVIATPLFKRSFGMTDEAFAQVKRGPFM